jgi:hypothetical protein
MIGWILIISALLFLIFSYIRKKKSFSIIKPSGVVNSVYIGNGGIEPILNNYYIRKFKKGKYQ